MSKKLSDMATEEEREEARRRHHENYLANRKRRIKQSKESQRRRWAADPEGMQKKSAAWKKNRPIDPQKRSDACKRYYRTHRQQMLAKQQRAYRRRIALKRIVQMVDLCDEMLKRLHQLRETLELQFSFDGG